MMGFIKTQPLADKRLIDFRVAKGVWREARSGLECCTPNVSYGRMWCSVNYAIYEPEFVMAPVTGINANILISGDYPGDFEGFKNHSSFILYSIIQVFSLDLLLIIH